MATKADIREFELLVETNVRPLVRRRREELIFARSTYRLINELQMQLDILSKNCGTSGESTAAVKALVDVGAGFRMHVRVENPEFVAVDVGCGIFVEMTIDEALRYCAGRKITLGSLIGALEADLLKTGADLAIAESGLEELHKAEALESEAASSGT